MCRIRFLDRIQVWFNGIKIHSPFLSTQTQKRTILGLFRQDTGLVLNLVLRFGVSTWVSYIDFGFGYWCYLLGVATSPCGVPHTSPCFNIVTPSFLFSIKILATYCSKVSWNYKTYLTNHISLEAFYWTTMFNKTILLDPLPFNPIPNWNICLARIVKIIAARSPTSAPPGKWVEIDTGKWVEIVQQLPYWIQIILLPMLFVYQRS
ncbi:hypothetical protein L2E82_43251 [Cichorium intybus]|uniref:Uncharacterized protein n=1 Tax=Cichorium intybus TaxID=13427 RepID=A0ACB8ZPA4_CICIN|nr:hypothetical protein L2E82_43251 [Cichorium intybus]